MSRLLPLLVLALSPNLAVAQEKPARPNILFVFTDDHAAHAISAYGSKINRTPNIDRLAREGMLFRNCFCTNSICAPSRAVILTGKHSHVNGVVDNVVRFDGSQPHIGKLLGEAGYQTAMLGKWHLKSDPTGFDYWEVLPGQGVYYNPVFLTRKGKVKHTGYVTDIITDKALAWLEKGRDRSKPFLLMYQHKAPHRSWEPGPKHLNLYRDVKIPEPDTLFDDHAGLASPARKQEMTVAHHLTPRDLKLVPPGNLTPEQRKAWDAAYGPPNEAFQKAKLTGKELVRWHYQRYIKDYLRCVASVDDNLGRVLAYLDESGLAKNTVVIYSSDQGFYLGDRGWYDKRWMYEESLRMPLIVRWPGTVKPGSENTDLVQNLDFAETFLDVAGVKAPDDMQGRSLIPLLKGATPKDWRKSIYYHYFEYPGPHSVQRHYGVRTARYKLIHYYQAGEWELFDLKKGPGEHKSVYAEPGYADVVKELKEELTRLRKLYRADTFKEPTTPKRKKGDPKKVKPALVLRYTFAALKKERVEDVSGNGLAGRLVKGKLVKDDVGPALELEGEGHVGVASKALPNFADSPLVVGAWCSAGANRGVVAALGGEGQGFSLFLTDGVPTFAVRSDGKLSVAKAANRMPRGRWAHLMGVLDAAGRLRVWVDGKPSGDAVQGAHLARQPSDGLSIGADTGSRVGDYNDEQYWTGRLRDVRLYRGVPTEKELHQWAGLSE
jgi:arylsulfatase A-like enzyme